MVENRNRLAGKPPDEALGPVRDWMGDDTRIARRHARIEKWALQFDKELLAQGIAHLFLCHAACRAALRSTDRLASTAADVAVQGHDVASALAAEMKPLADKMKAYKDARRRGAAMKLANDRNGKQAAKNEAFKLWQDWQEGKTLHKSGAAFARFVCDKHPVLQSPSTVERWARKWAAGRAKK